MQLPLEPIWIDGHIPPPPGQKVVRYYYSETGEPTGPVISTPIHADGSHLIDGESIYRETVCWMPVPALS